MQKEKLEISSWKSLLISGSQQIWSVGTLSSLLLQLFFPRLRPQIAPVCSIRGEGEEMALHVHSLPSVVFDQKAHSLSDWLYPIRIALLPGRAERLRPADWAVVTITAELFTSLKHLSPADPSLTAAITADEIIPLIAIACCFQWPSNFSSWNCVVALTSQSPGCNCHLRLELSFRLWK